MTMDAQTAAVIAATAAAISAFAALVSLLVGLGALRVQSQAGKPKVRVVVTAAMLALGPRPGAPVVDITAQNRGLVPVTINSAGFDLGRGRTAPLLDPRGITGEQALPRPLQPGEAVSIVFGFLELARIDAIRPVRGAFVSTATGGRYTTRVSSDAGYSRGLVTRPSGITTGTSLPGGSGLSTPRAFAAALSRTFANHTISYAGMVGGGPRLSPGEVTLAEAGITSRQVPMTVATWRRWLPAQAEPSGP